MQAQMGVGLFFTVAFIAISASSAWQRKKFTLAVSVALLVLVLGKMFFEVVPVDLGYGHVARDLNHRLADGVIYQTISKVDDGEHYVLLVTEDTRKNIFAVRVEKAEAPSGRFVLVNGKAVAVQ